VFGIVKQLGGSIWVYSELGKGTTFKIYLPCTDEEGTPVAMPAPKTVRGNETILLLEDEDAVREAAVRILGRAGYHVLPAKDPQGALRLAEEHQPPIHLLLSDVVMPLGSGPEVSKRLLAVRPDMKVLFMSGYTDEAVVHHGVLESGAAFIQKPLTPETLTAKVREVLAGERRAPLPREP
jgi:DNA-binding NtrC family response regulator